MSLKNMADIQMDSCKEGEDNSGVFRMYANSREAAIKHIKKLMEDQKLADEFIEKHKGKEAHKNESAMWKMGIVDSYNHLVISWIRDFWNISYAELDKIIDG